MTDFEILRFPNFVSKNNYARVAKTSAVKAVAHRCSEEGHP